MSDVVDLPAEFDPDPIEIERCELCGFAIEDVEELIYLRAADLVAQWERADPRDAWRHTGDPAPSARVRSSDIWPRPATAAQPYRPAQSTIDAFRHLTAHGDVSRLRAWLADHPKDAPYLLAMLEGHDNA